MPKTETTYTDEELGLSEGWDEQLDPNISAMRRHAKVTERENRELRAQLAERNRLDAFVQAGVPADAKGKAFAKIYEGSDDPTEVKAAFEELFGPSTPAGAGASDESDTGAERRIVDATNAGASQGLPGTVDFADALKNAKSTKEVLDLIRNAPEGARSPDGYRMRLPDDQ